MLAGEFGECDHVADGRRLGALHDELLRTVGGGEIIELDGDGCDLTQRGLVEVLAGDLLQGAKRLRELSVVELKLREMTQGGDITGEAFEKAFPQHGRGGFATQGDV